MHGYMDVCCANMCQALVCECRQTQQIIEVDIETLEAARSLGKESMQSWISPHSVTTWPMDGYTFGRGVFAEGQVPGIQQWY